MAITQMRRYEILVIVLGIFSRCYGQLFLFCEMYFLKLSQNKKQNYTLKNL